MGLGRLLDWKYERGGERSFEEPDADISTAVVGDRSRHLVAGVYFVGHPHRPIVHADAIGRLLVESLTLYRNCKALLGAIKESGREFDSAVLGLFDLDGDFFASLANIEGAVNRVDGPQVADEDVEIGY